MDRSKRLKTTHAPSSGAPPGHLVKLEVTQTCCLTEREVTKHVLTWTLKNFTKFNQEVSSPLFPTRGGSDHWQVTMSKDKTKRTTLSLQMKQGPTNKHTEICFNISFLNRHEERLKTISENNVKFQPNHVYQLRESITSGQLESFSSDGVNLIICCEVEVLGKFSEAIKIDGLPPVRCTLVDNLGGLLKSRSLTDVTIEVDGKEFKAHRGILAARSPMFNAMFSHDMQESLSNRVKVEGVSPEVFEELLLFIYTGKPSFKPTLLADKIECGKDDIKSRDFFVMDVLAAADRYQLDGLKILCEQRLSNQLSLDSVVGVLSLVNQYNLVWLKKQSIQYAKARAKQLTDRGAWRLLAENNPDILLEFVNPPAQAKW